MIVVQDEYVVCLVVGGLCVCSVMVGRLDLGKPERDKSQISLERVKNKNWWRGRKLT